VPPTLGNRRVTTKLRLRNGETGIIAGLMRGSSTNSRSGIPLLNQIPFLRDVFSSNKRLNERTDILLSISPRILRMPDIAPGDIETWRIGTGARAELQRLSESVKDWNKEAGKPAAGPEKGKRPPKKKPVKNEKSDPQAGKAENRN